MIKMPAKSDSWRFSRRKLDLMFWLILCAVIVAQCAVAEVKPPSLEDIYILRSIREAPTANAPGCSATQAGFDLYPTDSERVFSFWSVSLQVKDGKVVDTQASRVADLHGCFGPTSDRARQNFYADITLGILSFRGKGDCLALQMDTPEPGMFPVRCQLILTGLPAPYVGGVLTTNTLTSKAAFGGDTDPTGYTQASIATLRLWKSKPKDCVNVYGGNIC